MGNNSSQTKFLEAKTKLEDYDNIPDVYRIIDPKGGGELVDLAWLAHRTHNLSLIDNYIRNEVSKYVLNDGKGEQIPIDEIIQHRNRDAFLHKKTEVKIQIKEKNNMNNEEKLPPPLPACKTRLVCFDLNRRGRNGETLLHLCFANGSYLHMLIAKRLLHIYPCMINDICIGDEHYGETALHLAIVNEDPYMVQFLLNCGADVNERACGRFFMPDDQKDHRQNLDHNELPTLPINTNYECYSYFGEYPICFAAILSQEECVRLLIAHSADINSKDLNGNTALHMCVINNNLEMFQLLIEHNANLEIKNRQGYTPLALAAELCRVEIFFFILEHQREVYWIYADISCAAYPLTNVDTISETGGIDTKSVLYLLLNKNTEEHLEMLEGFITDLLYKKWTTFVRNRFYFEMIVYLLFFVLNAVTLFLKRLYYDDLNKMNCTEIEESQNHLTEECECAYRNPNDDLRYPRTVFEIIVFLYTCVLIVIHINEVYVQRWQFVQTLLSNPTRVLYLIALLFIVIILPLRLVCNTYGEDILVVMIIIFISINTMYYARGFKFITTFVYNFHMILRNNIIRFFIIYAIFLLGFSQTFYLIFIADPPVQLEKVFNTVINSFLHTFILTIGEVAVDFENYLYLTSYVLIGSIFTVIYLMIGTLVLVNILIAMMDHTQEITNDRPNEWLRQWGKHVICIEQNVSIKERLKQQKRYAHQMNNGVKALIVRWHQSKTEREESKHNRELFQESIINVQPVHKNE